MGTQGPRGDSAELEELLGEIPDGVWQYLALGVALLVAVALLGQSLAFGVAALAVLLAAVTVVSAVEIVDAYDKEALTVFGEYRELLEPGVHLIPPFVSRTYPFDMRTQTIDVPSQSAITRDNSPVTADAVVYIKVMDAKKAFLEVDDYKNAVSNLAQTTLRAVIGDMELDDTLSQRELINDRINEELDEPTDEWGIRVEAVEVREVSPSQEVQRAMEQQTGAERRRRAMILEAQGERRSAVEQAEGDKQSNIIRAQGEKQSQILEAQGDAISTVLRARSAESMGERAIIERGMETLEEIGKGESTTFVLPQELTSLVGRYGKALSGSDVQEMEGLEGKEFDEETEKLLGLEDIESALEQIDTVADDDLRTDETRDGDAARDVDLAKQEAATREADRDIELEAESERPSD
ncbi:SPFH/Band 7/PHB domain protein [Halorubrum ezzemoulense]|uniref:SPFH/Band 7/PHB domain protein n=1 Tax=Halorubrum ezzemoulense TaxID=337243 RepID=A0ABT4Z262_HALEZ|nr:SPFH domain-containing protein [Halorubrum ezzemoulense]MDB2244179.1 SPFH/Band 7/PHB domain protein [Halorubrum ezzemoulense]MDB2252374.1 SPFH/Band 7/PHB domain protein [Halorubrum ezzemoulense]MDB2277915.1 SPFH/Band 7/PHB domain protein [Halorubrum ezzemoulense]MDB2286331.1 SPFH/Band 7/PHB domain protein [Halorubrum ezzemoulense]MDB2289542.1 SPFH/Band 7/PHB domain protein [Halorubrum ezzemoulense]